MSNPTIPMLHASVTARAGSVLVSVDGRTLPAQYPSVLGAQEALGQHARQAGVVLAVAIREQGRPVRYVSITPDGRVTRTAAPVGMPNVQRDLGVGFDAAKENEWMEERIWGSGS